MLRPLIYMGHLSLVLGSISFLNPDKTTGTTYQAYDVFDRPTPPTASLRGTAVLSSLTVRYPCTIASISPPPTTNTTTLLMVNWAPLAHYGCKSLAHLLYQTSLLGLPNAILGVHGNDLDTMYDALGPRSRVCYSADEWTLNTTGLVVDPLFVQEYQRRQSADPAGILLASYVREENPWTTLVYSSVIQIPYILFRVLFSLEIAFGFFLVAREVLERRQANQAEFRRVRPHLAGVMGLLAIYALLAWTIYLPIKSGPIYTHFLYYTGLLANTLAFCLMVQRWTRIIGQIRPSKAVKVLRYAVIVCILCATVSFNLMWISYVALVSDAFIQYSEMVANYILTPLLIAMSFLFLILAVRLLMAFRAKSLPISRRTRQSLHRMTIFGIAFWFMFALYFILPISVVAGMRQSSGRYITIHYCSYIVWALVNGVILWIWAARVFSTEMEVDNTSTDMDASRDEDRVELSATGRPALLTQQTDATIVSDLQQEELDHALKWNTVLLRSGTTQKKHQSLEHGSTSAASSRAALTRHGSRLISKPSEAGLDGLFGSEL